MRKLHPHKIREAVSPAIPATTGPLTRMWEGNNSSWSDSEKTVWIKTYEGETAHKRCMNELVCSAHTPVLSPKPLHTTPIPISEQVWAGAWNHVGNISEIWSPYTWNLHMFQRACTTAEQIHRATPPQHLTKSSLTGSASSRAATRQAQTRTAGKQNSEAYTATWAQIKNIAEEADTQAEQHLNPNETPYVWCHGDFHAANLYTPTVPHHTEEVGVFDWESSMLAPAEWDIASLLYTMTCAKTPTNVLAECIRTLPDTTITTVYDSVALKAAYHLSYIMLKRPHAVTAERLETVMKMQQSSSSTIRENAPNRAGYSIKKLLTRRCELLTSLPATANI